MSALPPLGPPHAWSVPVELDPVPLLASLVAHAVPGVEVVDGSTVRRLVPVGPRLVAVTADLRPDHVTVSGDAPVDTLEGIGRRWFGLDDDLAAVVDGLGADPVVGPHVRSRPGIRVLGHLDGFEATVTTVLGQQVSLAAARVFSGRLAAGWGRPGPDGLLAFPTPDDLAAADPARIQATARITGARARSLHAVAVAFADGLALAPGDDPTEARRRLLALPGIGPWTAEYLALRVLADRDALPAGDVVLRKALGVDSTPAVAAAAEPWRPWRAYAAIHLWTQHVYGL